MKGNKRYLIVLCIFSLIISLNFIMQFNNQTVYADDVVLEYSAVALNSDKEEYDPVDITAEESSSFTNIKYIENADYFKANPLHKDNYENNPDNSAGVCTTVAVQLLMGYHNYYSDRRIIPEFDENGKRFLAENYGDIDKNPKIDKTLGSDQGKGEIGTEDTVYRGIYDLTFWPSLPGLGQGVNNVTIGANRFLDKYTPANVRNTINLTSGNYNKSEVLAELNNDNPVVVCFSPNISIWHVVPIYGYATYKGEFGYIVHYGWGDSRTHVWIQEKHCRLMIKMSVNHVHDFEAQDVFQLNYQTLKCQSCGAVLLDDYWQTTVENDNCIITGTKYPLTQNVEFPENINGYPVTEISVQAFKDQQQIEKITFPESLVYIGDAAFKNCQNLASVNFADFSSLTTIGKSAFASCKKLNNINLPYSLLCIDNEAFFDCDNLSVVKLPQKLTSIGNSSFANCKKLKKIDFPLSLTTIGAGAFWKCETLTEIFIPRNVTYIGYQAFAGCKLQNINFNAYECKDFGSAFESPFYNLNGDISDIDVYIGPIVKKLPSYIFADLTAIKNVIVSSYIEEIGDAAFLNCTNIQDVYYTAAEEEWNEIKINLNNTSLTNAKIYYLSNQRPQLPGNYWHYYVLVTNPIKWDPVLALESITVNGIDGIENTTQLTFTFSEDPGAKLTADKINIIGAEKVGFGGSGKCRTLDIDNISVGNGGEIQISISSIDGYIIVEEVYDATVYLARYSIEYKDIGNHSFSGEHSSQYPDIHEYGTATVLDQPTKFGYTFKGWYLNSDGNGDAVQILSATEYTANIVLYAKWDADPFIFNLINDGSAYEINKGFRSLVGEVIFPSEYKDLPVIKIAQNGFSYCNQITKIFIPATVREIGEDAFLGCYNLTEITVDEGNTAYCSDGNCLIRLADMTLLIGFENSSVPLYVKIIGNKAFEGIDVTEIALPQGLTDIGERAFADCQGLTTVTIPSSVKRIGKQAFYNCKYVTAVNIPQNSELESIGDSCFEYCTSLTDFFIPANVNFIGEEAFLRCNALTAITTDVNNDYYTTDGNCFIRRADNALILGFNNSEIPQYIEVICDYAFANKTVNFVNLPSGLKSIGKFAFVGCGGLSEIAIPASVETIGASAFEYCSNIEAVLFDENSVLTDIMAKAFGRCEKLQELTLPASLENVGNSAFYNCSDLISVYAEAKNGGVNFGSNVFYNCDQLQLIMFKNSTMLIYAKNNGLSSYADILKCLTYNSIVITDLDLTEELPNNHVLDKFNNVYNFCIFDADNEICQKIQESGVLFYITRNESAAVLNELLSSVGIDLQSNKCAVINLSGVLSASDDYYPMYGRDYYSAGFNIAAEYVISMEENVCGKIDEVCYALEYYPVIAPLYYKNNVFMLTGLSDIFGVPVKIVSTSEEVSEEWNNLTANDVILNNWLVLEMYDETVTAALAQYTDLAEMYYFYYDETYAANLGSGYSHVYKIEDKVDYLAEIALKTEADEEINAEEWLFDYAGRFSGVSVEGYVGNLSDVDYEDWYEFWLNEQYVINAEIMNEYALDVTLNGKYFMIEQIVAAI